MYLLPMMFASTLFSFFSLFVLPRVVWRDQGANFTSHLFFTTDKTAPYIRVQVLTIQKVRVRLSIFTYSKKHAVHLLP